MNYHIIYTDMVSENWQVATTSPLIPSVGENVLLPSGNLGKVFFIEHVYKVSRDEIVEFDYLKIYLDWETS